jgi:hypothetical protein
MAQELAKQELMQPEETLLMKEIVEELKEHVEDYKERQRTLLQRFFPDRQQRYIETAKRKAIKAHYEFQTEAIQVANEAQLQRIREMYNDFLIKGKAKIRKDRSEFFQQQIENLMTNLSYKSREFIEHVNAEYQQLEKLPVDFMKERQARLIQNIVEGYYETVEKLIRNFQCILDEEIQNPGASRSAPPIED